jgi:hypothetical protein
LQPHHYLCDIACGSLRAGRHFIAYLDPGHYLGIDKEKELIEAGRSLELSESLYSSKMPEFLVSSEFEFEKFSNRAHIALAQSLFTHLPLVHIQLCLRKLRQWIRPDGTLYATFFETFKERDNPQKPHDHQGFSYTREQIVHMGACSGWVAEYIGQWNHPRKQIMIKYRCE